MRRAWISIAAVTLVIVGYSAAWVYAAGMAQTATDRFLASEHAQGRDWTCPDRTVGGYPFAITITCQAPTFAGQSLGEAVQGSVAALRAGVGLTHPRTVEVRLTPPFRYRNSTGQTDITGTWTTLGITLGSLPDPQALSLAVRDLTIGGAFGHAGAGTGKLTRLAATFKASPDGDDRTLDFDIAAESPDVAALDDLFGDTKPVALDLGGRLDHASAGQAETPEDAMEIWRRAGGRIDLGRSLITRGDAKVTATGALALDESHRLKGQLDANLFGLEPVLARYGISGNIAAAGSLLSTLFGHAPKVQPPPGALSLPISFVNGRMGIGPVRTPVQLQPLY